MKMNVIYGLAEPVTKKIRYVGQTKNGMRRVNAHTVPSVLNNPRYPVDRWCAKLSAQGFKPELVVLEEFEVTNKQMLDAAEIRWIAELATKVPNGLNLTDGGEGRPGYVHTEETKVKLRKAWVFRRNRPLKESTREKFRFRMKGNIPGNSRPVHCVEDDLTFPSAAHAARFYGVTKTHVRRACDLGKPITRAKQHLVWVDGIS